MAGTCNLSCYACHCLCRQPGPHPNCKNCQNCKSYDNHIRKEYKK
ncbi:MAG: hypothetical protein ACRC8P_00320 [Spiroplasma sp.]